jgi:hypothetical protein
MWVADSRQLQFYISAFNIFRCMKMGSYEAKGTGLSKKVAKTMAAQMMYNTIPEEWKNLDPPGRKRKKPKSSGTSDEPAAKIAAKNPTTPGTAAAAPLFVPSVGRTGKNRGRGRPDKAEETSEPRPVHQVVSATNPISAIFEYCKKGIKKQENVAKIICTLNFCVECLNMGCFPT